MSSRLPLLLRRNPAAGYVLERSIVTKSTGRIHLLNSHSWTRVKQVPETAYTRSHDRSNKPSIVSKVEIIAHRHTAPACPGRHETGATIPLGTTCTFPVTLCLILPRWFAFPAANDKIVAIIWWNDRFGYLPGLYDSATIPQKFAVYLRFQTSITCLFTGSDIFLIIFKQIMWRKFDKNWSKLRLMVWIQRCPQGACCWKRETEWCGALFIFRVL